MLKLYTMTTANFGFTLSATKWGLIRPTKQQNSLVLHALFKNPIFLLRLKQDDFLTTIQGKKIKFLTITTKTSQNGTIIVNQVNESLSNFKPDHVSVYFNASESSKPFSVKIQKNSRVYVSFTLMFLLYHTIWVTYIPFYLS